MASFRYRQNKQCSIYFNDDARLLKKKKKPVLSKFIGFLVCLQLVFWFTVLVRYHSHNSVCTFSMLGRNMHCGQDIRLCLLFSCVPSYRYLCVLISNPYCCFCIILLLALILYATGSFSITLKII